MQVSLKSSENFGTIEKRRISVYATAAAISWTLIIGSFIVWDVIQAKSETANRSKSAANTSLNKDIAFRQWVSKHGGVYVPATKETPPNPHLSHIPERDIQTPAGNDLTLMNPAYALRQVMEDYTEFNGVRGHITSLKPLRKENAPDEWERRALLQFEKGTKEVSERTVLNGETYLRLMRPFITEKACLKCHEAQGYKEGDVRGGISVSVPMALYLEEEMAHLNLMAVTYGSTWVIVLFAIYLVSLRLQRHISSRMKAENEVLIHANRNQLLLESAAEGIIGLDRNGIQIFVNSSAAGMLGYEAAELINRKSHPIWHNTNADASEYAEEDCPVCKAYQKGEIVREEALFRRKDGSSFPVEYAANPIMEDQGFIGVVLTFEDITKRKEADRALRKSEKSLKDAQRIARIGNWEHDLISNSLTWSDEIYKIFEIDPEQCGASYKAFLGSVHPDDREFVNEAHTDSINTRIPLNIVYRLLNKNGRITYVKEQCETEYDSNGKPLLSIGTVQDITEQRLLEEQLRQSQKMEVVGHLAGGIAHDFNNILSAIIGYSSMAQAKMKSSDPLKYNIDQVLDAANRAAQLTRSLLAFSRKQTLHSKPCDLNEVIKRVEKLLVRLIGEDIDFKTCFSAQPLTIMADSGQIEQVLMNLVANARDAMPKGGLLAIGTERTTINSEFARMHGLCRPGEYAEVSVTDTGIGIDEETQKKIFEPFFTTKELGKGTGLGLAMVYGIISQHEGVINVQSDPGKGTTFSIYLPLISEGVCKEDTIAQGEPPAKGTETILVAEDDRALRKLAVSVLEEYGYTVIAAVDGEDAVSKFKENHERIGLLLFDLVMPKMTGKEAYNEIRAVSPDIRVIFLSGYSPDILRDKVALENEASVLYKPVHPTELLKKIRSVLDEGRA